jgi:hypothetical protein
MMKDNFNLPLTALETGIYDNKHNHVATTTQSQDKAMVLAVNSHDKLVKALNFIMDDETNLSQKFFDSGYHKEIDALLDSLEGK